MKKRRKPRQRNKTEAAGMFRRPLVLCRENYLHRIKKLSTDPYRTVDNIIKIPGRSNPAGENAGKTEIS